MSYPRSGKKSWADPRGAIDDPSSQQSMVHSSQPFMPAIGGPHEIHSPFLAEIEPNSRLITDSQDMNTQAISFASPSQLNRASLFDRSAFEKPEELVTVDDQFHVAPHVKPNLNIANRERMNGLHLNAVSKVDAPKLQEPKEPPSTSRPPSASLDRKNMEGNVLRSRAAPAIPKKQNTIPTAPVTFSSNTPLLASELESRSTSQEMETADAIDLTGDDPAMGSGSEMNGQPNSESSSDTMDKEEKQEVHGPSHHNSHQKQTHERFGRESHQPRIEHDSDHIPHNASFNTKQRRRLSATNTVVDSNLNDTRQGVIVDDQNATSRPLNNADTQAHELPKRRPESHAAGSSVTSSIHMRPNRMNAVHGANTQASRFRRDKSMPQGDLAFHGHNPSASPSLRQKSRAVEMTRPFRQQVSQQPESSPRSYSRGSNISKPRKTTPALHRRNENSHRQKRNSSHEKKLLDEKNLSHEGKDLDDALREFGQSWNNMVGRDLEYRVKANEVITRLEERNAAHERLVKECQFEVESQQEVALELEAENAKLRDTLELRENRFAESSLKIDKLDEKCRYYKDYLNKARGEQQRLYCQSKEAINKALSELHTEKQGNEETIKQVLKTSESVRLDLQKKVAATVNDARQHAAKLDITIATLRLELEHRGKELSAEKESNRKAQDELDHSRQFSSQTLQSLTSQNERILETIQEQRNHAQDAEISACKQNEKMNSVINVLEQVKAKVEDTTAMNELLKSSQENAIVRLTTEIQKVASSHQDNQALTEDLQHIKGLCQGITERMKNDEGIAPWREAYGQVENQLLQTDVAWKDAQRELEEVQTQLDEVGNANAELGMENGHLRHEVGSLKKKVAKLQGEIEDSNASESSEVAALQKLLTSKSSDLEKSDHQLKDAEERLRAQDKLLKENESSMRSNLQRLEKVQQELSTANQRRQQSISDAVGKETKRLQDMQRDTKARLDSAEEARGKVDQDLQKANERIQQLSLGATSNGQDIRKLTSTMNESTRKVVQLMTELAASKKKQEDMAELLEQWKLDKANLVRMEEQFKTIKKDQAMALEAEAQMMRMIQLCEQQVEFEKGNARNDVPAGGSTLSTHAVPTISSSDGPHTRDRHVVMKSPIEEEAALALSVTQERANRRQSLPAKPIIKMTRRASRELEAQKQAQKAQSQPDPAPAQQNQTNPTPSAHSSFNRPVQGSVTDDNSSDTTLAPSSTSTGRKRSLSVPANVNGRQQSTAGEEGKPSTAQAPHRKRQKTAAPAQEHHNGQSDSLSLPLPTRTKSQYFPNDINAVEDSEVTESDMTGPSIGRGMFPKQHQPGGPMSKPAKKTIRTYGSQEPHHSRIGLMTELTKNIAHAHKPQPTNARHLTSNDPTPETMQQPKRR